MGNVPISCCRSKSPRLESESRSVFDGMNNAHSSSTNCNSRSRKFSNNSKTKHGMEGCDHASIQQSSQNILQHISEREPDDSDTDPSSNPLNRPIFAQRSSNSSNQQCKLAIAHDSYSSNSTNTRKQTLIGLTSSQDQGYNSSASTNLTQYDGAGHLISRSFNNSIQNQRSGDTTQQQVSADFDGLNLSGNANSSNDEIASTAHDDTPMENSIPYHSRRYQSRNDNKLLMGGEDRLKASSCSTIFIDNSTISQPDLDQTIKCVSLAIFYHIKDRSSDEVSEIFDEAVHPLRMPAHPFELIVNNREPQSLQKAQPPQKTPANISEELLMLNSNNQEDLGNQGEMNEPDQETIYNFVRTLFRAAQLTSEYAITTLVYLERLMTYAEMDLTPRSWRRMFLGAILLSSKVWEDQAIWNVDYAQILDDISVDDINELERQFLELIQFNMNVPSSIYAKYYFHLRTLALKNGLTEEQTLMTTGKAQILEAMSKVHTTDDWFSSPIHRKSPQPIKRHTSLEKLRLGGHTRAVLM